MLLLAEDLCMRCAYLAKDYDPTRNYLETNGNSDRDAARRECLEVSGQLASSNGLHESVGKVPSPSNAEQRYR